MDIEYSIEALQLLDSQEKQLAISPDGKCPTSCLFTCVGTCEGLSCNISAW
ncbi:hypothetical protein [Streptomyces sp. HUAS ZL42]|uniref:hypothetical protein n=1 Tax=Streptomyces sp. HUAS ZL42 TaxID=3231715 RepID=UPI00345ECCB9